jgi:hypothetical protein
MAFIIDGTEMLSNGEYYKFLRKHRIGTAYKKASQWIIQLKEEYRLCDEALYNDQYKQDNYIAYNLKKDGSKFVCLGKSKRGLNLYIGKFVNTVPNLWHGYPADYISNNQDKPKMKVLEALKNKGIITPQDMRRISKGQKL